MTSSDVLRGLAAQKSPQLASKAAELAAVLADMGEVLARNPHGHEEGECWSAEYECDVCANLTGACPLCDALARLDVLVAALTEEERAEERREHEGLAWRDQAAEDEQAYDLRDPKHPRHYEVMADLWDFREGK